VITLRVLRLLILFPARQRMIDSDSMHVQLKLKTLKSHGAIFRLLRCHFKVTNYFVIFSMQIKLPASIFSLSIFSVTRCQFPVPIPLFACKIDTWLEVYFAALLQGSAKSSLSSVCHSTISGQSRLV